MSLNGLVPRPHGVRGFSKAGGNQFYGRAGVGAGDGSGFSVVSVGRIYELAIGGTVAQWNCNLSADVSGWMLGRTEIGANPVEETSFSLGAFNFTANSMIRASYLIDRTFMLGYTFDGANWTAYMNGARTFQQANAFTPSTTSLYCIGGTSALPDAAMNDYFVAGAYVGGGVVYTPADWAALFRYFKNTGRINHPTLPMELRHETIDLLAADATAAAPTTWVNTGSLGASGDLNWLGTGGFNLQFDSDRYPIFSGGTP